ncbi:MAG: hypothetical protein FJ146_01620 [Deltaproteobacteria bacterium]|nr:hypothetical protein [Deltaproteobacteria bacterium]
MLFGLTLITSAVMATSALAVDDRDQEIFGAPEATPAEMVAPRVVATSDGQKGMAQRLADTLQIGGRLEVRLDSVNREATRAADSELTRLKQADLYFDTRPNTNLRSFLRLRLSEGGSNGGTPGVTSDGGLLNDVCVSGCVRSDIDEMWLKWDIAQKIFVTYGKQHVRWGSGRLWNPSDFTSIRVVDPLALFDRRLGVDMLRVHLPFERQGYNLYAVLLYPNAKRVDQLSGALRGEFAFGGIGELALSLQTAAHAPLRAAIDLSVGLGPVDIHTETVVTKRHSQTLYKGKISPATGELPTPYRDNEKWFVQSLWGMDRTIKYSADDVITIGAEYFYNQFGYDQRDLELYSMVNGQSPGLYAGRRYLAIYMNLPNPGSLTDISFFLNSLSNLSDETHLVRLTSSIRIHKEADLQAYVSRCFGDYGEFCFRITDSLRALGSSDQAPPAVKQVVQSLPNKRNLTTAGVGLVVKF